MPPTQVVVDNCLGPERVDASIGGGRYSRLCATLPPLDVDERALHALGGPGGACDHGAAPDVDARGPAGWPMFGQYIAHDITADRSPLGARADPDRLRNFRTPKANLESVYGAGPIGSPYLYDQDDPAKLLLGPGGHDIPRNQQGIGLIGDPRNDVHLFVSQMQVAWIKAHNTLVDRLREAGTPEAELAEAARREAMWHYQYTITREFLPTVIGDELTAELLDGGIRFYCPAAQPYIPFEFADAAFRYGHSQIRELYQINDSFGPCAIFPELLGFGPVSPEHTVDWSLMFDVPGAPPAQRAKRIDGCLPQSLLALPQAVSGEPSGAPYASLATRDLQRGQRVGLPSGEALAREFDAPVLDADQIGLAETGWRDETPLWFYILKESHALEDGERLGPVGGRIVGEVLIGIIDADEESYRCVAPSWTPTLPAREPGRFSIADVLVPAGDRAAA